MRSLLKFLRSYSFTRAILISTAAFIPMIFSYYFFDLSLGRSMSLGVLTASLSDIPGTYKYLNMGMLLALALGILNSFIVSSLLGSLVVYPVFAFLVFANSYIAVYGFRASLVAFAGLVSLCISFAPLRGDTNILEHLFFMAIGGLWYIVLSNIFKKIRSRKYSEEQLGDCISLTAQYLSTRGKLLKQGQDRDLYTSMLQLQNEIFEKHETIRNDLISRRMRSGNENLKNKQLLIFIELVDIMELSIANTHKLEMVSFESPPYESSLIALTDAIEELALHLEGRRTFAPSGNKVTLEDTLDSCEKEIGEFGNSIEKEQAYGLYISLSNTLDYIYKLYQKINSIDRIIDSEFSKELSLPKKIQPEKFLTHQNYDPRMLMENFTLESPIFRHSLRLVITMTLALILGNYFKLPQTYWIFITIVVIMRPGYVLTKQRSVQRVVGTLIGLALAAAILFITQNTLLILVLTFVSFTLGFTFTQQNYKASAAFLTLTIIFLYSLLTDSPMEIIEYRLLDSIIGAGMAATANLLLWPTWESKSISACIANSIEANRTYLREVERLHKQKIAADTVYKLSRKQAFIQVSNLHAAFQRMTQEPQRKQVGLKELYEIVVINHTFLSSTAALGTHTRMEYNLKEKTFIEAISLAVDKSLASSLSLLKGEKGDDPTAIAMEEAKESVRTYRSKLQSGIRAGTAYEFPLNEEDTQHDRVKGMRLIVNQLSWLLTLSENLHTAIKGYRQATISQEND